MFGKTNRDALLAGVATLALSSLILAACGVNEAPDRTATTTTTSTPRIRPVPRQAEKPAPRSKDKRRAKLDVYAAGAAKAPPAKPARPGYRFQPNVPGRDPVVGLPRRDREKYQKIEQNPVKRVAENPVSTFSVDVDTGGYANVRRFLTAGRMPPADAVRVEEMINYFGYTYPVPVSRQRPFRVTTEVARTPWNKNTYLLHIGIKGYDVQRAHRPPANLVFLVDVSGSMHSPKKLPLLKAALSMLADNLGQRDRVSLVVYAGRTAVVLEPTSDKERVKAALEQLRAGGRTAGGAGIKLAYAMARKGFIEGGINRVILATDGDFNVGVSDVRALKDMVARQRKSGITLTTLGFGVGNYNEHLMEQIANVGNGNYAYIDTLNEARKVLVTEMNSTLFTIAKDVKVQIEFNQAVVAEYRLIGYANRMLKREDFKNDKVDAGDIGAGHTVTAIYEIALKGGKGRRLEALRYGNRATRASSESTEEFAFLRLRYKHPQGSKSKLLEVPLMTADIGRAESGEIRPSRNYRFAAAVAAFGQMLRGGKYTGDFTYDKVIALARNARGEDRFGYRAEFISLVRLAQSMDRGRPAPSTNTAQGE